MSIPKELEDYLNSLPKGKKPKSSYVYKSGPLSDEEVAMLRKQHNVKLGDNRQVQKPH